MFEIGSSKKDITCFIKGVGMFGYGMHFHRAKDIETRLFVRTFTIKDKGNGKKSAFICAEILSCTTAIRKGVIKKLTEEYAHLGYFADNVIISATHTHSAPGGYSHYALYNITIPGFVPKVYETIVNGIVDSVIEADRTMQPGKILFGNASFDPGTDVAYNRSLDAYNRNEDVDKLEYKDRHLAVNRNMYLLKMEDMQGNPMGCINWFGVHTTSVGNDYFNLCADNKGYAADYFEDYLKVKNSKNSALTIFAQEACGDVSPNYIWSRKRHKMRGKFVNDYDSARYNGKLQFEKAREIFEGNNLRELKNSTLDYALAYNNFCDITVDPEFANGKKGKKTGSPCLGVAFFEGVSDGYGIPKILGNILRVWIDAVEVYEKSAFSMGQSREKIYAKYKAHGKKHIMMETAERRILGTPFINKLIVPGWADKTIFYLKKQYNSGGLLNKPWAPNVLPAQIMILGNIAIAAVPGEISTVSGIRLRKTIHAVLKNRGIEQVIISPYSNAFSGYITTHEEYQEQCYEGGHTMYGEYTLAAHQTKFKELALEMLNPPGKRKLFTDNPVEFTDEDLRKRMFDEKEFAR